MSRITYTALRELEPTGFAKTGTDISAALSDDSFNASSTDLSGLLTDQWVLVSGFANAANNGWFQLKSNSTSTKILQLTPPITHLRLPGATGNYASTPDSAANSIAGDIDIRIKVALDDWTPPTTMCFLAKYQGSGQAAYRLIIAAGALRLLTSPDGTTDDVSQASTAQVGVADGTSIWIRVTRASGSGLLNYYTSLNYDPTTGTGTWTLLGAADRTSTPGGIFNSTASVEIGTSFNGAAEPLAGRVHYAEIRNGIAGTVVAKFDASQGTRNGTTIISSTGETWTINSSGTPPAMLQGPALVTAAAGPSVTITGYKRGVGQTYDIEFGSERADRSVQVKRSVKQPMGGGAPEVLLHRRDTYFEVRTTSLEEAVMPQWREFLASVEGGETFSLDRYGTVAAPVELKTVVLESNSYTEAREFMFRYRISFKVHVL